MTKYTLINAALLLKKLTYEILSVFSIVPYYVLV